MGKDILFHIKERTDTMKRSMRLIVILFLVLPFICSCDNESSTQRNIKNETNTAWASPSELDSFSIDWIATSSSTCFSKIGYDSSKEVLCVEFRDSESEYAYFDVPKNVWSDLCKAQSKGSYYNKNIKGKYACERMY